MRLQEQPETKAEFLKRSILDYGLGLKAFTFTIRKNNHIECIRKNSKNTENDKLKLPKSGQLNSVKKAISRITKQI